MVEVRIGSDIDGVALRYTERMAKVFKMFGGHADLTKITTFDFFKMVPDSERKALYLAFGYMMQETLDVYDDYKLFMAWMLANSRKMRFITARQSNLSLVGARRSLDVAFSNFNISPSKLDDVYSIDCTGIDGRHGSKVSLIKGYGMEYFIEDRRKNVLEISQAGITVFMPRRTFNELPEKTPNVIQYDSAVEIIEYFEKM